MPANLKYILLIIACIVSRIATSINYIEDIDSLRFALSAIEFDVMKQQPHFPGYPFFCYILNFLNGITENIGLSFSIIGGISIFFTCFYLMKIAELLMPLKQKWLIYLLPFCHPFLWLMSNRYMPDIMGLSILIAVTFYVKKAIENQKVSTLILISILIGIECGVRLSYLPFFIPVIYFLKPFKNTFPKLILGFIIGISCWLIPFILENNISDLINIGIRNTKGHFLEWGGTVNSNSDPYFIRAAGFFRSIWADSLNCWYPGRSPITILTSFVWIYMIFIFFKSRYYKSITFIKIKPLIICLFFYSVWIFFFQNIVYKPRHIIPLIPFILLFIFLFYQKKSNNLISKKAVFLVLVLNTITCFKLVDDHLSPSAISQSKDWVKNNCSKNWVFCSNGLRNFYYKKQISPNELEFVNVDDKLKLIKEFTLGKNICTDLNLDKTFQRKPIFKKVFYHNPNVNRLWSEVTIRTYQLNNEK